MEDKELLNDFVIEAKEHLADVENQFLQFEEFGESVDVELVNEVFRAIHSIKGAAGFLGLTSINDVAHHLENLLNMMRTHELIPNSEIVDVMLRASDTLREMVLDAEHSNEVDVSKHVLELEAIAVKATSQSPAEPSAPNPEAVASPVVESVTAEKSVVEPAVHTPAEASPSATCGDKAEDEADPVAVAGAAESSEGKSSTASTEANIRVPVGVLDSLMNLAGELVLSRNQLLQVISNSENAGLEAISARLDQVTSELQEAIMQTRMQQIGSVFGRFPRVVRDLSSRLGKKCQLEIEGKEVEVDKTIIEAIGDPLTHLVRNSVDHGIEMPQQRLAKGKPEVGTLSLRAFYQAGKVRIEIEDDGGGMDPARLKEKAVSRGIITPEQAEAMSDREALRLIFAPGFSTAAEVTDVSGRGVGMDVVRTNIAKLGGTVDVESTLGKGTNIVVTLPLTLAIIPSLIVQVCGDRFAIPQVNIAELVRVRADERATRLGRVKNTEVLRLRGSLLPLVRLRKLLSHQPVEKEGNDEAAAKATNIIVVDTGQARLGLVVDGLHDSEEIVVKPLGRHQKNCRCLAGATILGDGHVALILDIAGIAMQEEISSHEEVDGNLDHEADQTVTREDLQSVLLFETGPEDHFAVPMDVVSRIERVRVDQIDSVGGQAVLQYRQSTLPLIRVDQHISTQPAHEKDRLYVVVFNVQDREVGLIAPVLNDIRDVSTKVDTRTFREPGIMGSLVVDEHTIRLVDLFELVRIAHPDWFVDSEDDVEHNEGGPPHILLAEDSAFFRSQVQGLFEKKGYRVEPCEDGAEAWEKLQSGEFDFDVIVTDIEMPNMNGFELCRRVKQHEVLSQIPVIALTSLAANADVAHGIEVGIDDYQIKMDREKLLQSLKNFVDHSRKAHSSSKSRSASLSSAHSMESFS